MGINQGLGQGAGRYTPGDTAGKTPEELKQEQEKRAERVQKDLRAGPSAPKPGDDYTPVTYDPQYILMVNRLKKYFPIKGGMISHTVGHVKAVDGVTFNLKRGTTMGLVGESGCGKTTTGRTILRLSGEKTGGQVLFNGKEVYDFSAKEMRALRTQMQIIFQDPFSSLSPRLPVGEIIGEAVREHNLVSKEEFNDYIDQVMDNCGLQSFHKERYPHEFSGGQRQRICIARALALNPEDCFVPGLDLWGVSEFKRGNGGSIEIKFADRVKAISLLLECAGGGDESMNALLNALEAGEE